MIGMDMGVDDEDELHSGALGGAQVKVEIADRIDDGAGCLATAAE